MMTYLKRKFSNISMKRLAFEISGLLTGLCLVIFANGLLKIWFDSSYFELINAGNNASFMSLFTVAFVLMSIFAILNIGVFLFSMGCYVSIWKSSRYSKYIETFIKDYLGIKERNFGAEGADLLSVASSYLAHLFRKNVLLMFAIVTFVSVMEVFILK